MNIDKHDIYNLYDIVYSVCKFAHPNVGPKYEIQWAKTHLPLIHRNENGPFLNPEFKDGDAIFADSYYMEHFICDLNFVNKPFILVSGDSDKTAPYCDYKNKLQFMLLLDNPYLIKWYSTNVDFVHPKIIPIPIGIPKHVPILTDDTGSPYLAWCVNHNINNSKDTLYRYMNSNLYKNFFSDKPEFLYSRMSICNSDYCFHEFTRIRRKVFDDLEKKGFKLQKDLIDAHKYYDELVKYKMCLSLPGAGLDCYRTWECLFLGVVPIILKTQGLYDMFKDLPVIIIEDFTVLTKDILYEEYIKVLKRINNNEINWDKFHCSYWIKLIKN